MMSVLGIMVQMCADFDFGGIVWAILLIMDFTIIMTALEHIK